MRFLVIGGGISGSFLSYYLLKDGHDVVLIDMEVAGVRTSAYNAGLLSAAPSFTKIGISHIAYASFNRSGSVYVSPKEVLRHPRWFIQALTMGRSRYDGVITHLAIRSIKLYREFFSHEKAKVDLAENGLRLYSNVEDAEHESKALEGRFVDQRELLGMGYKGFGGAALCDTLSLHSGKLLDYLKIRLSELGARTMRGVARLISSNSRIAGAAVGDKVFNADAYVVTAGSWSGRVCEPLRYDPLIRPARGLVLLCQTNGTRLVDYPASFEDEGVVFAQHDRNLVRMTSFFELVGFRNKFRQREKNWLLNSVKSHLSRQFNLTLMEEGVGYRPCTPDQVPIVGRIPGYDNGFIVSGSSRKGIVLAPILSQLAIKCMTGAGVEDSALMSLEPRRFR